MFDKAANVDEFNVSYAAKRLASRNVTTRILVVLADGMTRGSVEDLADSVSAVEQGGTIVLGIGIGDQTVQAAYSRNQVVERPDDLAGAMVEGVRSTLFQTLAVGGGNTWWANTSERVLYDPTTPRSTINA
jgi:cobalamin biosynthesis protein CobT